MRKLQRNMKCFEIIITLCQLHSKFRAKSILLFAAADNKLTAHVFCSKSNVLLSRGCVNFP